MCFITVWKYLKAPSCGHSRIWRDGCERENDYICDRRKREVDYHEMSGDCDLCRRATYNKLVAELKQERKAMEEDIKAFKKFETSFELGHDKPSQEEIQCLEDARLRALDIKTQLDDHVDILFFLAVELNHMEAIEVVKFHQQLEMSRERSRHWADVSASLEIFEITDFPAPVLKGHPLESILEISGRDLTALEITQDGKQNANDNNDGEDQETLEGDFGVEAAFGKELTVKIQKLDEYQSDNGKKNFELNAEKSIVHKNSAMETLKSYEVREACGNILKVIADEKKAQEEKFGISKERIIEPFMKALTLGRK